MGFSVVIFLYFQMSNNVLLFISNLKEKTILKGMCEAS